MVARLEPYRPSSRACPATIRTPAPHRQPPTSSGHRCTPIGTTHTAQSCIPCPAHPFRDRRNRRPTTGNQPSTAPSCTFFPHPSSPRHHWCCCHRNLSPLALAITWLLFPSQPLLLLTTPASTATPPHSSHTQDLGAGILANLHSQRETIVRSRDTLHGADDNITKARKILSSMSKRMLQNKLIMFGIIGTLLAAIILIIYFKTRK